MAVHFLNRGVQFAFKAETTQGTAETLAAADVDFRVGDDVSFILENEAHPQDLMTADLSELPDLIGNRPVRITFQTLLAGSGTATTPPGWAKFLKSGGFLETVGGSDVQYTPETIATTNSATIGVWRSPTSGSSGRFLQAKGCRMESLTIDITTGMGMKATAVFRGAFVSLTDAAVFAGVTFDATVPQTNRSLGMTWGSWTPFFSNITINYANTLAMVVDPGNASQASGISHFEITGRQCRGTITFMDILTSVQAWNTDLLAGTERAFTMTLGGTAGNKVKLDMPKMQLLVSGETTLEGLLGQTVNWKANRSSGNDEFKITTF